MGKPRHKSTRSRKKRRQRKLFELQEDPSRLRWVYTPGPPRPELPPSENQSVRLPDGRRAYRVIHTGRHPGAVPLSPPQMYFKRRRAYAKSLRKGILPTLKMENGSPASKHLQDFAQIEFSGVRPDELPTGRPVGRPVKPSRPSKAELRNYLRTHTLSQAERSFGFSSRTLRRILDTTT